ncbi:MAG: TPM domain-containing protein [Bacteroidetes bacterium]|nr:TPM domain-containing protein [Bacteroidota bacterium]
MKTAKSLLSVLALFISVIFPAYSQDIPERPVPPHLVNDFAGVLSQQEVVALEGKLVAFNDSTSTQIAIVTVASLGGYDIIDYAQRLGEKWGIGQRQLNNGLLIVVKPKTSDSGGKVTIVAGYGLEGAIPDITCGQIIDNEVLPAFRQDNYFAGLDAAINTLMALARGEYSASEYGSRPKKKSGDGFPSGIVIFIIIIIILSIFGKSKGSNNRHLGSGNLPIWLLLGMMNSGGSHRGSWGGFSGGSGGGGGGFGGFGGGSFGGGGASGSW